MTIGPSGLDLSKCDGDLTINTVATRCPAWWAVSLAPCRRYGERGGSNLVLPTVAGERAQRRRRRGRDVSLRFVFGGLFQYTGAEFVGSPGSQMWTNFDLFTSLLVADPGGNSAVTSTFTDQHGVTHTTPVQVLDLVEGEHESSDTDAALRATLYLRVMRGGWI